MTGLYDILKANRLKKESDPWLCILGEAWRASEEGYKEYTGLVPYTFIGNGQPLISWIIKGNTVQSGTPTPDNPIMPQGTGERTRNLFDESTIEVGGLDPNTGMEVVDRNRRRSGYIAVDSSTYYSIFRQLDETLTSNFWALGYDENKNVITDGSDSSRPGVILTMGASSSERRFKTTPTTKYIRWYVTANNSYSNIMLNLGSEALPYEPYGYKIPISSAGQTMPIYLGEVETTRKVKKLVLTGDESWSQYASTNSIRYSLSPTITDGVPMSQIISSHFKFGGFTATDGRNGEVTGTNVTNLFRMYLWSDINTVDNFKSYLAAQYAAGTPVTVWYVLAEPETGIVNEPLMKIGEYADSISDVVSIPTVRGENVFDVETEVKPSEVYIKYKSR